MITFKGYSGIIANQQSLCSTAGPVALHHHAGSLLTQCHKLIKSKSCMMVLSESLSFPPTGLAASLCEIFYNSATGRYSVSEADGWAISMAFCVPNAVIICLTS